MSKVGRKIIAGLKEFVKAQRAGKGTTSYGVDIIMSKKKKPESVNPWPERLKRLRAKRGLTQAQAAEQAQVALRTWINWENAHQKPGSLAQVLLKQAFPELDS